MTATDVLADFERDTFTYDGKTRDIFRIGTGPAVIVIAEMPGITPKVLEFARRVAAIGCTAVLPHLFGSPGRAGVEAGPVKSTPYLLSSMVPTCISRDFTAFATGKTSPVIDWLRALTLLGVTELDDATIDRTLGSVLKYAEDQDVIRAAGLGSLV